MLNLPSYVLGLEWYEENFVSQAETIAVNVPGLAWKVRTSFLKGKLRFIVAQRAYHPKRNPLPSNWSVDSYTSQRRVPPLEDRSQASHIRFVMNASGFRLTSRLLLFFYFSLPFPSVSSSAL